MSPLERAQHLNRFLDKSLGKRLLNCLIPMRLLESSMMWFCYSLICAAAAKLAKYFFPELSWGILFVAFLLIPFVITIAMHYMERWEKGRIVRKSLTSVGLEANEGAIFLRNGQKNDVEMSAHNTMAGLHYIESLPPKVQAVLVRGPYLYHVR